MKLSSVPSNKVLSLLKPFSSVPPSTRQPTSNWKTGGALLPGKFADIAIISDLENMVVDAVFMEGNLVAAGGKLLIDLPKYTYPDAVKNSVRLKPVTAKDLQIRAEGSSATARVIGLIPDQNLSEGFLKWKFRLKVVWLVQTLDKTCSQ